MQERLCAHVHLNTARTHPHSPVQDSSLVELTDTRLFVSCRHSPPIIAEFAFISSDPVCVEVGPKLSLLAAPCQTDSALWCVWCM